jgi:hypothetical protein
MIKNPLLHHFGVALVAICLGLIVANANAGSFTRGCAARDMQLHMMIEERENSNTIDRCNANADACANGLL